MELQHRLARQAINIAVSKAMEDMESNAKRSIRNLIDLGLFFSKSENHRRFFTTAQKIISNPRNPYTALAKRMIADMNPDAVKNVGLNLGYSSLTYGANKLKKSQEDSGISVPWLLIFDISESDPVFFEQMSQLIKESRELGIYSYIVCPHKQDDILALCEIAKRFEECLFVLKVTSGLISEQTAGALDRIHNAMVAVQVMGKGFHCESNVNAFRLLKQNRCLYGFHTRYNEKNMNQVATPEYIRCGISLGNLFGVYIAEESASEPCRDSVYDFIRKERGENGQPLIALEWYRDIRYISGKILSGDGYLAIDLAEKVYCELKTKDALPNLFLEILQGMKPCASS